MASKVQSETSRTIPVVFQDQVPALVNENLIKKGFTAQSPTPGCTYVVQPPSNYQGLFQNLQSILTESGLPISTVRMPHATVIAAKVVDQSPNDSWSDLEQVQRIYRSFFLYVVKEEMVHCDYPTALKSALAANEHILAAIAAQTSRQKALEAIPNEKIRKYVDETPFSDSKYTPIKRMAIQSITEASFQLRITEVKVNANGTIIFQLNEDDKLLRMRLDLIIAGQGISKWPKLSVMKSAWSSIAFTTKSLEGQEKEKLASVLQNWTSDHQEELRSVHAQFDASHLGALAFRSNDFCAVKRVVFPVLPSLDLKTIPENVESNLDMSPRAGAGGISPTLGHRIPFKFVKEDWHGPMDREVSMEKISSNLCSPNPVTERQKMPSKGSWQ